MVDAETGRVEHETPMAGVGDELHHFGWNRCSSVCHGNVVVSMLGDEAGNAAGGFAVLDAKTF